MLCLLAKLDADKVAVVGSAEEAGQAAAAGSCVSLVVREGVQVGGAQAGRADTYQSTKLRLEGPIPQALP